MEKRVVLFLVLSLGIIFGYDLLLKELGYSPFSNSPIIDEKIYKDDSQDGSRTDRSSSAPADPALERPTISTDNSEVVADQTAIINEEIIFVETPLVRVGLSNQGAVITSWELKQFLTQTEENIPVQLVYTNGQYPGPLTLKSEGHEELTTALRQHPYRVKKDFEKLDERNPTGRVEFTYGSDESDVWVEKVLVFHYDSYVVDIEIRTRGISEKLDLVLGTNFGVVEWGQGFIGLLGSAWMIGEELVKESPEADDPTIRREGPVKWLALQDKYFISVFMPEEATGLVAKLENEMVVSAGLNLPVVSEGQVHKTRLYAGPKQFDVLRSFGNGLEDTIDFGWFIYGSWAPVKFVAKPLFSVLRYINDYTHNFGWAIILLTLAIKLLFVPLQYKSYKSMQGMKTIQGPVAKLQEKYKDDKQKLNTELMKLYKEHKVNPVGGCLPMFLQMPVFIALFNILYMTIDLRQAPFMLWIHDLSIQDPFYVLPVLMGASMFVQQKIMPTTADPNMAKMMLILPIGLTFLFVTFPAGLVLYWVTNNVLTITQQFVTDRYVLPPPKPGTTEIAKTDQSSSSPDKPGKKKPSSPQSGKSKKS
ncbi:MAG: membrane protein insertase YidC [Nitrospirota bacterium]|nr:membrane protein insertase YidC [Nitrospirota bacterium]